MLSETDLWVVPPSNHSAWFARLDWYLNWQMCKGLAHRPARPSPEVERLAAEYDIPIPFAASADPGPLLIASHGLVPAEKCLVLPYAGDLKAWLTRMARVAEELRSDSVAVFLPSGVSRGSAESLWPGPMEARFVEDQEDWP